MVGLSDLFWAYQNSGPALLFVMIVAAAYVWHYDIKPRLNDIEAEQERRAEQWDEQQLNAQERTMLIDDADERVDQVSEAVARLRQRLRELEQVYAAEHGSAPNGYQADTDNDTGFPEADDRPDDDTGFPEADDRPDDDTGFPEADDRPDDD